MSKRVFSVGLTERVTVTVTEEMIDRFAMLSGDTNSLHMQHDVAKAAGFPNRVAHGVLTLSFLSTLIGMKLPGEGALWRTLKVEWMKPVFPGDTVTISGSVTQVSESTNSLVIAVEGENQSGASILRGEAVVGLVDEALIGMQSAVSQAPTHRAEAAGDDVGLPPVLITGGSRGIGRTIALNLAERGYPVAIGYHSARDMADEVVEQISNSGGSAVAFNNETRDVATADKIIAFVSKQLGPVVSIVHTASPPLVTSAFQEQKETLFQDYWSTYVMSGMALSRAILPNIQARKWGRIVFLGTSAISGLPPAKMTAYVTAKSGLWGLTKSLAQELGPSGATVNMVSPGLTRTELTRDYSPRMFLMEAQKTPMRRLAEPDDTASVVAFLLSDGGSFVTGVNLPVTGGAIML